MTERDELGRFRKGESGNPNGRPPGPTTAALKASIRGVTTHRDIIDIWLKAIDQAKHGNDPARRFVFTTLGLIEILVDVTSAGEKIDFGDDEQRLGQLAILFDAARARRGGEAAPGPGPAVAADPGPQ